MFFRKIFLFLLMLPFGCGSKQPSELEVIEKKIAGLKEELHQSRLVEMDTDVRGQKYMIGDWEAYAKDMELIRKKDETSEKLELEIKQLEQQKQAILNQKAT